MNQLDRISAFRDAVTTFRQSTDRQTFLRLTLEEIQGEEHSDARKEIALAYMQKVGAMVGLDHISTLPEHLFSDADLESFLAITVPTSFEQHTSLVSSIIPLVWKNRKGTFERLRSNEEFRTKFPESLSILEKRTPTSIAR